MREYINKYTIRQHTNSNKQYIDKCESERKIIKRKRERPRGGGGGGGALFAIRRGRGGGEGEGVGGRRRFVSLERVQTNEAKSKRRRASPGESERARERKSFPPPLSPVAHETCYYSTFIDESKHETQSRRIHFILSLMSKPQTCRCSLAHDGHPCTAHAVTMTRRRARTRNGGPRRLLPCRSADRYPKSSS
jgi:hypothetical protein